MLTNHELKPDERQKWVTQLNRMRTVADEAPPDKPLDREGLEKLRAIMNSPRKGKGPKRVK